MYLFKDEMITRKYNKKEMAIEIGVHPDTLRKVLNQGKTCSKLLAYCITKYINADKEIKDYFTRNGE